MGVVFCLIPSTKYEYQELAVVESIPDLPGNFDFVRFNTHIYTAIPYRVSTGFLQGIPCVVFPPLHALAVYRV